MHSKCKHFQPVNDDLQDDTTLHATGTNCFEFKTGMEYTLEVLSGVLVFDLLNNCVRL